MLTAARSRRVILFLPPYAGKVLGPPLGLLSLAGSLRVAGYIPVLIDGALDRDYMDRIAQESQDCACFGVSLLTGPMIRETIAASKFFRNLRPNIPVIFGGWHPSLMSEQTLREDYVDIVIRHQGDRTLVEVLDRLAANQALDLVAGCWFKRNGRIIQNPDRPAAPLESLPSPAYDLVDFDTYARAGGGRKLPYATSTGCPYACNYCTDMVFYNRRFNPYDVDRVVRELTDLVQRHDLSEVALVDSNFLVDVPRALAIAQGIIDSQVHFKWTFQASTDLLCRMTDAEVGVLAQSGVSHIGFGTESASPQVLTWMNKRHQKIADIHEAARKCCNVGIRVTLNLIFAYPGEEEHHRQETLREMGEVASKHQSVMFSPNIFTPYPSIPIWPELEARGLMQPESLEEWADIDLGVERLPWLQGATSRRLRRSMSYFLLNNRLNKAVRDSRFAPMRTALRFARTPLHWRLRNHRFGWPWELWLSNASRWMVVRRSLLTGQPLSRELSRSS